MLKMANNMHVQKYIHKASSPQSFRSEETNQKKKEVRLVLYYGKHVLRSPPETPVVFLPLYRHF